MTDEINFGPLTDRDRANGEAEFSEADTREVKTPCTPPADAETGEAAAARLFRRVPTSCWTYRDAKGVVAFCVARWNEPDGAKTIRPLSWFDGEGWRFGHWPDARPLYALDKLAAKPDAPVVVTEGEKAADAAARIFPKSIATTSSGGANAYVKTDWKPIAGRRVLIWPDNDEAGRKYAREIAMILAALGCSLSIVDAKALAAINPDGGKREAKDKWDAADAATEWRDLNTLREAAVCLGSPFAASTAGALAPLPLAPPVPAARPYPIAALGATLSEAADSIAAKCQCAPALVAQAVLAVASLAAQRLADVRLPFGQTRPLSLFLVTIAASGDRKSTADNEALIPVRLHEKNLKQANEVEHEKWRVSYAAWAAQHRKIENDKNLDRSARETELIALGRAPIEPIESLLTAPEPTVEGLAKHWHALPGALGLFSSEGGQMTGGHGFGPDHRLKTAATLSTLWDGAGIRRLRAGDGVVDLPGRRLALHLMVQPHAAAAFLSEPILRDQGLLSRLLVAAPETLAGSRIWCEPASGLDVATKRYVAVILDLLKRPALAANIAGNELTPRALALSVDAKAAWVSFHDQIEAAMAPDGALEGLRDVAGKAAENAARVAGVLTIVDNPEASSVEAEAMAAACQLMAWYVAEALRLSGQNRQPAALRSAIKLLDWLRAKGGAEISLREIMRTGPNPVRGKAEAEAALAKLEEHGWLEKRGEGRGARWSIVSGAWS